MLTFYSSAKIFKSVASHAVFVYNKPWINRHANADICAASSLKILDNYTFQNQPVCLKITSESENELLNMNFQGKYAIKFVHGLPKLEPSRNVSSKVIKS